MARYSVFLKRSAAAELEKLPRKTDRQRIVRRIGSLAADPRPPGSEKLAGCGDRLRIRQGDYRVLYEVNDAERTVTVVRIAHRKDVYRA